MNIRSEALRCLGLLAIVCVLAGGLGLASEETGEVRSLVACVRLALENNPTLESQIWKTRADEAALKRVVAERRPRLDFNLDATRSDRAQRVAPPSYFGEPIHYDEDLLVAETSLTLPLYQGGGVKARTQAAEQTLADARHLLDARRQDLVLDVVAAYTRVQEQQNVIHALEANSRALEVNLDVVRALEAVGRVAHLDALKVDVRLAALRQQLSTAHRDLTILRIWLNRLMGLAADDVQPEVSPDPVQISVPAQDTDDLIALALEQRPEILSARAMREKAVADIRVARSLRRPEVHGVAAYTFRGGVPWTELDGLDRHVAYAWGGIGASLPLWTGGRAGAAVAEAKAQQRAAEADLEALQLSVGEQVQQALATLQDARDRLDVAHAAAGQAAEALSIEKSSYEIGRALVNDVLDAQAALLNAQLDAARAQADVARSSAGLVYAVGSNVLQAVQENGSQAP